MRDDLLPPLDGEREQILSPYWIKGAGSKLATINSVLKSTLIFRKVLSMKNAIG